MKAVRKKWQVRHRPCIAEAYYQPGGAKEKRQLDYDGDAHHVKDILMNLIPDYKNYKVAEALSCLAKSTEPKGGLVEAFNWGDK